VQVYLNGSFLDHAHAAISVDDRGFLFADGVYEVIRVYGGRPFLPAPHIRRLRNGLSALRIAESAVAEVEGVLDTIVELNGVSAEGIVYIQVTRGIAPRKHAFPAADVRPSVYMFAKPTTRYPDEFYEHGVTTITVPDTRWSRCDIKTIGLLPNALANQQAQENDAFEALFVRDSVVIEGSHSNLFAVIDDTLITYPSCNYILSGITRAVVLELAVELDIPFVEAPLFVDRIGDVQEVFLSGTTTEIMPVRMLDGRPVGDGRRGVITERIQQAYAGRIRRLSRNAVRA
jgi:D-alanine transaminase